LNRRKVIKKYEFPDLVSITSPRFSSDGKRAVFSGTRKSGFTDIYIVELASGDLTELTSDIYNDIDPVFDIEEKSIIFSSDRCPDGDTGAMNLFRIPAKGGEAVPITYGKWKDITPEPAGDDLYFSSDRDGAFNIYKLDNEGTVKRMTSLLTGAYDPRVTPDKRHLVFSGYQDFAFHIYRTALDEGLAMPAEEPLRGKVFWRPVKLNQKHVKSSVKYKTEYSFDIAQSAVSVTPSYGSVGGLQMALSDMLGDNSFYFLLTNTAETKDEFLTSFNVAITYINKKRRINWGGGVFHLYDEYYNASDHYYYERQVGGLLHVNYPLSKFNRLEAITYIRYSDKERWLDNIRRRGTLMTNYLSFVSDNSLWDITGPIEGHRYNLTIGFTSRLDKGEQYNRIGLLDIRHYIRLGMFSAFASRIFVYSSTGYEPQRIYFGGSWSLRGYSRRQFYNRNIVFSSNELRFPLIDNLFVGFPIGGIGFQSIRGAIFLDAGYLTDDKFRIFDDTFFDNLLGSFGAGFRFAVGRFVVLRFDFAQTTDFKKIDPHTNFEFFFGWNF